MKDTNPTAKMAEEYFENHEIKVKDFLGHTFSNDSYKYNFEALIKFAADFAEFHHREKMKELIQNLPKLYRSGSDQMQFNDGVLAAKYYLSDLTKTEE